MHQQGWHQFHCPLLQGSCALVPLLLKPISACSCCAGGLVARTDLCSADSTSCLLHLPKSMHLSNNIAVQGAGGGLLVTNLSRVAGTIFGCPAGTADMTQCLQKEASRRRLLQDSPSAPIPTPLLNSASGGYGNDIATAAATMALVQYGTDAACFSESPEQDPIEELSIAPGQPLKLAFFLRDALGHCVTGGISDANMGLQVTCGLWNDRCCYQSMPG